METIVVKVTKEKNWAGAEYLIYSADNYGKIAEVDYATKNRKLPRVYSLVKDVVDDYICFSSIPSALVGAETICRGYFLDRGLYATFNYPKTIRVK